MFDDAQVMDEQTRSDADILVWLRRQWHEGYQSRLNALLRNAMLRDLQSKRKRG
jgi:uncharacterized protein (DUF4415 family)